eukprot:TRINITY_DN47984_c0_g1_i1.p1 TRINITY_DN47984_c0_g1~~TRINITY_DN47984_c0_g1_i1.p1  ORF type:complete len:276 (-),score=43.76 TRINITY_DN47984_c0_g1_i1:118-945(-)
MDTFLSFFASPPWLCGPSLGNEEKGELQVEEDEHLPACTRQPVLLRPDYIIPCLSERTREIAPTVLEQIGLEPAIQHDLDTAVKLLLQACIEWRISLLEMEVLVLPPWHFDIAFPDRGSFFASMDLDSCDQSFPGGSDIHGTIENRQSSFFFGELGKDANSYGGALFQEPDGLKFYSARWVELLDGTVCVRWMNAPLQCLCLDYRMPHERFIANSVLMAALRRVPFSPEHAWIFPHWHRDRFAFLTWVGKELGFRDELWIAGVLPFLAVEPKDLD